MTNSWGHGLRFPELFEGHRFKWEGSCIAKLMLCKIPWFFWPHPPWLWGEGISAVNVTVLAGMKVLQRDTCIPPFGCKTVGTTTSRSWNSLKNRMLGEGKGWNLVSEAEGEFVFDFIRCWLGRPPDRRIQNSWQQCPGPHPWKGLLSCAQLLLST